MENVNGHDQVEEATQAEEAGEELTIIEVDMDELKDSFISQEQFEKELDPLIDAVMEKSAELGLSMSMMSTIKGTDEDGDEVIKGLERSIMGAYVPAAILKARMYFRLGSNFVDAMGIEQEYSEGVYAYQLDKKDGRIEGCSLLGVVRIKNSKESEAKNSATFQMK